MDGRTADLEEALRDINAWHPQDSSRLLTDPGEGPAGEAEEAEEWRRWPEPSPLWMMKALRRARLATN